MHSRRAAQLFAAVVALGGTAVTPADAQFTETPAAAAYALQDITIIRADGSRVDHVNIVVRRGFIEAIGRDVTIPPDAELLEGDSLLVYPGIVDAQGKAEVEFPEEEIDRKELDFWAPPRAAQGFTPHLRVTDHLTATGDDLKGQRNQGVVAGAVHAAGAVMPGRGAFLLYRKDADTPTQLVLDPALGPAMSFRGAQGMYPSTVFGVMAFIRQAFEDAQHHGAVRQAHGRDPRRVALPEWDPDYAVLRAVMTSETPVFFGADRSDEIRRALRLADEYGFRPIIVGGDEAWKVAQLLEEKDVMVLVSLDFPKPERWKPDDEKDSETGDSVAQEPIAPPDSVAQEPIDPADSVAQEPIDPAAEREKQRLEDIYSNAGRLAAAGVRFALTSGGGKAEIREGARKAIEHGLSETAALAAITSVPASLFGADYLTEIVVGMPATFIVTDGPIFDEETKILHTFVAGDLERGKKAAAAGDEAPSVNITGTWKIDFDAGGQSIGGTITVTQDGASFEGSIELDVGNGSIHSGVVSRNELTFVITISVGGEEADIDVSATVEGDEMSGSGSSPFGDFTFVAKRTETPDRGAL